MTYNNTVHDIHLTRRRETFCGRPMWVTRVTGPRASGKTFTAQALGHYAMLSGADLALVIDESGEHYMLYQNEGVAGHGRRVLPRNFSARDLVQVLLGRDRGEIQVIVSGDVEFFQGETSMPPVSTPLYT